MDYTTRQNVWNKLSKQRQDAYASKYGITRSGKENEVREGDLLKIPEHYLNVEQLDQNAVLAVAHKPEVVKKESKKAKSAKKKK